MGHGRTGGIRSVTRALLRGYPRPDVVFQCKKQETKPLTAHCVKIPVLIAGIQVDSPDSFENVGSKWIAEINENCPGVKVVLTALKCDLRKDEEMNDNSNAITFDQGLAKAKEIGAVKYLGMWSAVYKLHEIDWSGANG